MNERQISALVIGASAGGIDALLRILPGLPQPCSFPVAVVLHVPEGRESKLASVFGQHLAMPVLHAEDKGALAAGTLYFAPPGYHLSIENDATFSLSQEEPVHFSRPAIDVLMTSAADAYGERLCGILLTGASQDGAAGLAAIGRAGGLTVAQDPLEADMPTMPSAAIALRAPDKILPLAGIRALLATLENM